MLHETLFDKKEINHIFYLLAKEYRMIAGRKAEAEIILVGGGAIVTEFSFRHSTLDIDACLNADRDIKMAITRIAEKEKLPFDWLNDDFANTESYSPKIAQYSLFYKRFCNCLTVRYLDPLHLMAMKLASWRPYKHDRTDFISMVIELRNRGISISFVDIIHAFLDLYGDTQKMKISATKLKELLGNAGEESLVLYKQAEKDALEDIHRIINESNSSGKQTNKQELLKLIEEKLKDEAKHQEGDA